MDINELFSTAEKAQKALKQAEADALDIFTVAAPKGFTTVGGIRHLAKGEEAPVYTMQGAINGKAERIDHKVIDPSLDKDDVWSRWSTRFDFERKHIVFTKTIANDRGPSTSNSYFVSFEEFARMAKENSPRR